MARSEYSPDENRLTVCVSGKQRSDQEIDLRLYSTHELFARPICHIVIDIPLALVSVTFPFLSEEHANREK